MMAALPPNNEIVSEVDTKESTLHAEEGSVEVIHNYFPALDFSSIPVEDGKSPSSLRPGADHDGKDNEWDPHRVYFNEFIGDPKPDRTKSTRSGVVSDTNSQFSPFGVAGLDEDEFDMGNDNTREKAKPSTPWTKRRWAFGRKDEGGGDGEVIKVNGVDVNDETLDPLGWPRQPSLLLVEATNDKDEDGSGDFGIDGGDGDDEDLLGPGLRGRSDFDAGESSSDTAAARAHEREGKVHRLEQYAEVEPDEASVTNSTHSSEPNQSSDDEEDPIEVEYQTQDDDDDDESDDFREEFQDLVLHMARQEKSDGTGLGTEAAQIEFATVDLDSLAAPPAFEVTWGSAPMECRVDEVVARATRGEENVKKAVDASACKLAPLLKPPPEEKVRKWLAAKDKP